MSEADTMMATTMAAARGLRGAQICGVTICDGLPAVHRVP